LGWVVDQIHKALVVFGGDLNEAAFAKDHIGGAGLGKPLENLQKPQSIAGEDLCAFLFES